MSGMETLQNFTFQNYSMVNLKHCEDPSSNSSQQPGRSPRTLITDRKQGHEHNHITAAPQLSCWSGK